MASRHVTAVIEATLALGVAVAVSWLVFGSTTAFRGPIPVLRDSWPLIYGSQAALAAVVGWLMAVAMPEATARMLIAVIGAAWLGEAAVLLVGGTLLANELVPQVAWFYWLIGTGGPIQPLAAIAGAALARRATARG